MRELGKNQKAMLAALKRHKRWYAGCGWQWNGKKETVRLLDSLFQRGLVRIVHLYDGTAAYEAVDK